jgi:hypothetical protein
VAAGLEQRSTLRRTGVKKRLDIEFPVRDRLQVVGDQWVFSGERKSKRSAFWFNVWDAIQDAVPILDHVVDTPPAAVLLVQVVRQTLDPFRFALNAAADLDPNPLRCEVG